MSGESLLDKAVDLHVENQSLRKEVERLRGELEMARRERDEARERIEHCNSRLAVMKITAQCLDETCGAIEKYFEPLFPDLCEEHDSNPALFYWIGERVKQMKEELNTLKAALPGLCERAKRGCVGEDIQRWWKERMEATNEEA